jgi:hypothetical protein
MGTKAQILETIMELCPMWPAFHKKLTSSSSFVTARVGGKH